MFLLVVLFVIVGDFIDAVPTIIIKEDCIAVPAGGQSRELLVREVRLRGLLDRFMSQARRCRGAWWRSHERRTSGSGG